MSERDWSHDELVTDLCRNRWDSGRIADTEVALSPWGGGYGGGGQADVVSIRPSWTKPTPTIFEVKASRSDLLSDLRKEKWKRYLPWCDRLYFAAPRGVAEKDDMPKGVGLFLRNENGWYSVKAARLHYREEEESDKLNAVAMALLLSLKPSPWETPHPDRYKRVKWLAENRETARAIGDEIAGKLQHARRLRSQSKSVEEAKSTLRAALDTRFGSLTGLAEKAAERLNGGPTRQYNATCEVVSNALPMDRAFDPVALASHVANIIRERDALREKVEQLEGADA